MLLVFANTGAGRAAIAHLTASLSGGELRIDGLDGRFPQSLHLARIEIRDQDGPWLTLDNVALDWSPLRLLTGEAAIERLSAARIRVARLPVSSSASSSKKPFALPPLRIALADLHVARLELAAPVAGAPAVVAVNGNFQLAAADSGSGALDIERLDRPGSYKLSGKMAAGGDAVTLDASEPAQGLVAELAGLPDLGALSVAATLAGPRDAEQLGLALAAGAMRADGKGTIDLQHRSVDVDLTGAAPAMAPRSDIGWQAVSLDLHVHGGFSQPTVAGRIEIDALRAAGTRVGRVAATLAGDRGKLDLAGSLAEVHLPGSQPDVLAAAPIKLAAEAILDTPTRPLTFSIAHPLFSLAGQAQTGGAITASATLTLPDLAPLAAQAGADIAGHAAINATLNRNGDSNRIAVDGKIALTGGRAIATKLLGPSATLSLTGTEQGDDVTLNSAVIDGQAAHLSAHGALTNGLVDFAWGLTLADVGDFAPTLTGPLTATGRLNGPQDNLGLTLQAHGEIAAAGFAPGAIDASVDATGLPTSPHGQMELHGRLAGAPIALTATAQRENDGTLQLSIGRAQWKSLAAHGDLALAAGAIFPAGHMQLRIARLADLAPLIDVPVGGSLDAALETVASAGKPQAKLHVEARQVAAFGNSIESATLDATVVDPIARPVARMQLDLAGIAAKGVTGNATLTAQGPETALSLRLASDLQTAAGAAHIAGAATAQLPQRALLLTSLRAAYRDEQLRLLAPARLGFADGIAVDRLRLGVGDAVLAVAGRFSPRLQVTASLRNASPALAKAFYPALNASGSIALEANLNGTLAAPTGSLRVTARNLAIRNGSGGALPPADITATAVLRGTTARLDARLDAGTPVALQVAGTVPLTAGGPIDLRSTGRVNLAVLDPVLTAAGRSVHGQVTIDLAVAGTIAAPRASGTLRLAAGSLQDFVQGVHITAIAGTVQAMGDTLRLANFTGRAGDGTIAVNGTVVLMAPGMPVDLSIVSNDARPLSSDLLTATMDSDLTVKGEIEGGLTLGGRIHIRRADIQIPDSFPQSVAVLNVRKPGQKPAPPGPPPATITLALTVDAPEEVFVRGHGLDAEMGGSLRLSGTSSAPQVGGGFDLRRGTFSLAGQSLDFSSGRVAFDGFGLGKKLDPTLNFVAQSSANNVTATLTITGYADAPKIRLSSTPDLPQDEILAQLLFGESVKQLSPFQLLSIAQAVASISGVGGAADPLAGVRKGLGLDRLSVGAASGTTPGATVEAGKYVANGVYVGTKQQTSGGTQAQVQIDLTKHLKLESQLGTGGTPATGTTPDNDPGSSIGLTYQFEY